MAESEIHRIRREVSELADDRVEEAREGLREAFYRILGKRPYEDIVWFQTAIESLIDAKIAAIRQDNPNET